MLLLRKKKPCLLFDRFGNQNEMEFENENVLPSEKPRRTPCNVIVAN